jgi:hypothetical protein
LTQVPAQSNRPVPQLTLQLPPVQTAPPVHALVHWPQLRLSVAVLVQTPLQSASPAGQAQLPPVQLWPTLHAVPQAPQFVGSVFSSTHRPPQIVCPAGHVAVQAPLTQA